MGDIKDFITIKSPFVKALLFLMLLIVVFGMLLEAGFLGK